MVDLTQIFGNDGHVVTQSRFQHGKEVVTGCFLPFSVDGGFLSVRHCPVFVKAPEMVDPKEVCQRQLVTDPVEPPFVAGFGVLFPVVERISPQLSGGREIIRRHTCNDGGISLGIQTEQFLMDPDIHTVPGHEDRDVSDDGDPFLICISLQFHPFVVEEELDEFIITDLFGQFLFPFFSPSFFIRLN